MKRFIVVVFVFALLLSGCGEPAVDDTVDEPAVENDLAFQNMVLERSEDTETDYMVTLDFEVIGFEQKETDSGQFEFDVVFDLAVYDPQNIKLANLSLKNVKRLNKVLDEPTDGATFKNKIPVLKEYGAGEYRFEITVRDLIGEGAVAESRTIELE